MTFSKFKRSQKLSSKEFTSLAIVYNYIATLSALNCSKLTIKNTKTKCEICSNLTITTPEDVIKNVLVSLELTLNIALRNEKIVWKVVWIEHYLRLSLTSRRY